MTVTSVPVQGMAISVSTSAGKGPPVILCHGNSCSRRAFKRQFDAEIGRRFRLIALDLPGHGDSSRAGMPERTYSLPGYAEVLIEVAEALDATRGVFVGWSLGGHILLEATDRLAQAAGIMVFGTPPIDFPAPLDRAFLPNPAVAAAFQAETQEDQVRELLSSFFRLGTPIPSFIFEDFRRTDGEARARLGESLAAGNYRDEVQVVQALSLPLAILHGAEEQVVNGAYFQDLSLPSLWRGRVQVIPNVGHAPQWEDPEAFNGLLEAFVGDCVA
jgi:pimeloyl-ACP methyl ester carboxylesterase